MKTFTNQTSFGSKSIAATVSISGGSTLSGQKNIKVDQSNFKCLYLRGYKDDYLGKRTLSTNVEDKIEIFNIYPNPAQNLLTFSFESERQTPIKIRIYDAVGKEIYNSNFYDNSGELKIESFKNGLYNFTAEIGNIFVSKKLLILKY